jgi:hypothetical protein
MSKVFGGDAKTTAFGRANLKGSPFRRAVEAAGIRDPEGRVFGVGIGIGFFSRFFDPDPDPDIDHTVRDCVLTAVTIVNRKSAVPAVDSCLTRGGL